MAYSSPVIPRPSEHTNSLGLEFAVGNFQRQMQKMMGLLTIDLRPMAACDRPYLTD